MTLPVQYDMELLQRLGLSVEQAQELEANGITLEEYAQLQEEAAQLEAEIEILPVRYQIVGTAAAFQNEATGEIVQKLQVKIPYFHTTRVLFAPQSEGESLPPLCSSHDGKIGKYQDENGITCFRKCESCPYNVFGTDPNGGRGKACKTLRRIYILEGESLVPAVLNLPPSSHKAWDRFVSAIRFKGQLVSSYLIELSLEIKRNGPMTWSQLTAPKIVRELTPLEKARVLKIGKELEAKHRSISVEISDYLAVDGVSDAQPNATEETAQAAQA
ncbi:hypothetical protein [Alicyclobacillus sendaiensis]|uniref:Uncharacterized protein n=1 Tax=Alicyclobacillus sendaiensis PA2 TaxID=3029425 RepID=A0ABT6Y1S5_ALISE|nr:hypothetical protein [Alicyclobacillus sendaiensis]MDI9261291.1 hypothetical protein [Alicyclobacillus sendaiensis PA2]